MIEMDGFTDNVATRLVTEVAPPVAETTTRYLYLLALYVKLLRVSVELVAPLMF
jgi:hypothetical protein